MIDIYQLLVAITFGVIEGITVSLPISSTGHMILTSHILALNKSKINLLEIVVQCGSSISVLIIFKKKIKKIIFLNFKNYKKTNIIHISLTIIPTLLIGFFFHKEIKLIFTPINVTYGLILGSILLFFSEWLKPKNPKIININNITIIQCFIIGIFQCLSFYPGVSRLGSTVSSGLLLGIKKSVIIDFSLIIAIPIFIIASIFDCCNHINTFTVQDVPIFFSGFITSLIVSRFTITSILKIIYHSSLLYLILYRIILAIIIYKIL